MCQALKAPLGIVLDTFKRIGFNNYRFNLTLTNTNKIKTDFF